MRMYKMSRKEDGVKKTKMLEVLLIGVGVLIAMFLPVVPVWSAPVVPPPFQTYRLELISILQAIFSFFLVGVSYRWEWYTLLVMLLTLVAGFGLGRAASKLLLNHRQK